MPPTPPAALTDLAAQWEREADADDAADARAPQAYLAGRSRATRTAARQLREALARAWPEPHLSFSAAGVTDGPEPAPWDEAIPTT